MTLDLPLEWAVPDIIDRLHYNGLRPILAEELDSIMIEFITLPGPDQGVLFE